MDRDTFGVDLKRQREQRNLSLRAIAESTKIKESVLAALERNDFSQWPDGIFRRGYLRAYVRAIGLPPEPIVAEFVRLFPEKDLVAEVQLAATPEARPSLPPPTPFDSLAFRLRAAVFDVASVIVISGVLILIDVVNLSLWMTIGVVGLGYLLGGTIFLGRGMGTAALAKTDAWFIGETKAPPGRASA